MYFALNGHSILKINRSSLYNFAPQGERCRDSTRHDHEIDYYMSPASESIISFKLSSNSLVYLLASLLSAIQTCMNVATRAGQPITYALTSLLDDYSGMVPFANYLGCVSDMQ